MTNFTVFADVEASKTSNGQTIVLEKKISVSIEEAWKLWTDPEKLTKWLTVAAKVEPQVGGLYELFWDPDHPEQNSTLGCKILEMESNKMISFEWKGPVPFADIMNVYPLPTWVRITLSTVGKDQTAIRLEHFGWKSGSHWNEAKTWQTNAWTQAFSQL